MVRNSVEEYSNDIRIILELSARPSFLNIRKSIQIYSATTLPYSEEILLTKVQKIEKSKFPTSYFSLQIIFIEWEKLLSKMKICI